MKFAIDKDSLKKTPWKRFVEFSAGGTSAPEVNTVMIWGSIALIIFLGMLW